MELNDFCSKFLHYVMENGGDGILNVSNKVFDERRLICLSCDSFEGDKCLECGCYIPSKARVIFESCPLGKWSADKDEWDKNFIKIQEKIDDSSESL